MNLIFNNQLTLTLLGAVAAASMGNKHGVDSLLWGGALAFVSLSVPGSGGFVLPTPFVDFSTIDAEEGIDATSFSVIDVSSSSDATEGGGDGNLSFIDSAVFII